MKKTLFRTLSVLLCVLMVVECAPLAVFATAITVVAVAAILNPQVRKGLEKGAQEAYDFVARSIKALFRTKTEEKEIISSNTNNQSKTYYHATTYENAMAIALSGLFVRK